MADAPSTTMVSDSGVRYRWVADQPDNVVGSYGGHWELVPASEDPGQRRVASGAEGEVTAPEANPDESGLPWWQTGGNPDSGNVGGGQNTGGGAGGGGVPGGGGGGVSDFDSAVADVPVLGWATGATARRDAANAAQEAARGRAIWSGLENVLPSTGDLAVDYGELGTADEVGSLLGGHSALERLPSDEATIRALEQLQQWGTGAPTATDRQTLASFMDQRAQQSRGAREAYLANLQARGLGGSGTELLGVLSGQEGNTMANAQQAAAMQQAIQDRALQAIQAQGALSEAQQNRYMNRANALDAFNQQQLDWRRQRSAYNTGARDRSAESRADARRWRYGARERQAAGMTNQYQNEQQNNQQNQANRAREIGAFGSLLGTIANL